MTHPKITDTVERRFIDATIAKFKTRDGENGEQIIRGYAALFNSLSEDLGGFREQIAPGFFDNVLGNDVRVLFNHDSNLILARTTSATAKIGVDATGLWFEFTNPDTTYSNDLIKSLKRGDVSQCSFGFSLDYDAPKPDDWKKGADGKWTRTLLACGRLYDVSPVTYPAYPDTAVAMRGLEHAQKQIAPPAEFDFDRSLDRVLLSI